jgi:phosphatidate cytidylyltransferase
MLKWRVLTALVLVPPLIAAPFLLSTHWLGLLFGLFVIVGAWEWAHLTGMTSRAAQLVFVLIIALGAALLLQPFLDCAGLATALLVVSAGFWIWALVTLIRGDGWRGGVFRTVTGRRASAFVVLIPCWLATLLLHSSDPQRPWLILYLFVLTWAADTLAYFFGSAFGRTKLAPAISPGKTIEGLAGALISCVVFAWVCGTMLWKFEGARLLLWLTLAAVTVLFSVLGDLVESKLKRIAGVKDSGRILPGHGGVLDRIDSYSAAAPVFALGWILLSTYLL